MLRTLFMLGCAVALAPGCVTDADLRFLGMDSSPRATVVEATRLPLVLQTEPAPGEPGDPMTPGPAPEFARTDPTGFWNSPWVRPLHFGLPSDDPADAQWSVVGAGRRPLGLPPERAPERLTFGDDDPAPKPAPAKPDKK